MRIWAAALLSLCCFFGSAHASESEESCSEAEMRWGYFQNIVLDGEPTVAVWGKKDLYGKFKTKELCDADRAKYVKTQWGKPCGNTKGMNCKKGPPEECESFCPQAKK